MLLSIIKEKLVVDLSFPSAQGAVGGGLGGGGGGSGGYPYV